MIERGRGNLLLADVDALVNTVNTVGVMGKGLALQFKKAFPDAFTSYEQACARGELAIGQMHVVPRAAAPRFIINFPTKQHWKNPSKIEYVESGLRALVELVRKLELRSIALPPLGCGNGGLLWSDVRPRIERAFAELPDVRVMIFEPDGSPSASQILDRREKPEMTTMRAAFISLMGQYAATHYDYRLSLVEVQKLAYFLQVAGEPLRLEFKPHYYGPYADNLRKALRNLEGHYTSGLADGKNSPETPMQLLPGALEEAQAHLRSQPASVARLERVAALIEGFETPFGMELLGSVHWVMSHSPTAVEVEGVIAEVQNWSPRKRSQMKPEHIQAAWNQLRAKGWEPAAQQSSDQP
jgi:O-acetyl-ADP-ribose deacetylase (regulator of RNase III)